MLAEHIREQRLSAVISAPLAGADWAADRFADFREAGYRVEYVFLAVHEARSSLAVLDRYQWERDQFGFGRLVPPGIHDKAYSGVLGTVDRVEAERLVDAVYVVRRGGEILYRNSVDHTGMWREPPGLRQAIEKERSRPWTDEERDHFHERAAATADRIADDLKPALADAVRRALAHLGPATGRSSAAAAAQAFPSPTRSSLTQTTSEGRSGATSIASTRAASNDRWHRGSERTGFT